MECEEEKVRVDINKVEPVVIDPETGRIRRLLTCRERHRLVVIATYVTAKEIARELHITPDSAEKVIERLCIKLHCKSKRELILMAFYFGLVTEQIIASFI